MHTPLSIDHRGLTLIEVMIALAVFSVGILAVASMQDISMRSLAKARRAMFDSAAAGGQLERILSLPYNDPLLADPDSGYSLDSPDHGPFPVSATGSSIEWEVQDDYPASGTKRITVTVRKKGGAGGVRPMTYEYVKSKNFSL